MTRRTPPQAVAWLLPCLLIACGDGRNAAPAAPPTPAPTPRPTPGCGNGIVDKGEFCDGEEFCTNCGLALGGCCELGEKDGGTLCVEMGASPHACVDSHGSFSIGTTCEGSSCDEVTGICRGDGRCVSQPIEPVSVCCQLDTGGCRETVASDTGALGEFVVFGCDSVGFGTSLLGACGDDGVCVPR